MAFFCKKNAHQFNRRRNGDGSVAVPFDRVQDRPAAAKQLFAELFGQVGDSPAPAGAHFLDPLVGLAD
jgi:hypothetical protein